MVVKHVAWPQCAIVGVLVVAAAAAVFRKDFHVFFQQPAALTVYNDDINDNARNIRRDAQLLGEWQILPDGLGLSAGHAGTVLYKVTKEADEDINLVLWYYWNNLRQTSVEVSANGVDYQTVLKNTHLIGRSLRLTPYVVGRREIWIRLSARFTASDSQQPWIVLDKIQIIKVKNPVDLPYLPGIFLFIAIPLTVSAWVRRCKRPAAIALPIIVLAAATIFSWLWPQWVRAGLCVPLPPGSSLEQVRIPWVWLGYSIVAAGASLRKGRSVSTGPLLLVLFALALILRWEALTEFHYRPLDPDASGYRQIADAMKHPYDTSFREPLWIWIIKLWFLLLGSSDLNLRLLSVLLSLSLLGAAYKLFSECVQERGPGLATVALLAVHPYLTFMSIRGLRMEPYALTILLLARHALVPGDSMAAGRRVACLAVWGTAAVMVQLNSLIFMPLLWGYAFWRHKLGWKKVLVPGAAMAAVLAPHLLYSSRQFGDPFWSTNVHAKWYRNYEFVHLRREGCDGCPTVEEY
jgi:hypothetical protein